jgi:hypothetical protein
VDVADAVAAVAAVVGIIDNSILGVSMILIFVFEHNWGSEQMPAFGLPLVVYERRGGGLCHGQVIEADFEQVVALFQVLNDTPHGRDV